MWNRVSRLLERKVKKRSNPFLSSSVCYAALKIGEGLFRPISFKERTLLVSVSDSSSAASLQASQFQLIEKINQKLGQELVKKIRIKIGN